MATRKKSRKLVGFVTSPIIDTGGEDKGSTASFDFFASLTSEVLRKLQDSYDVVVRVPSMSARSGGIGEQQRLLNDLVGGQNLSGLIVAPVDSSVRAPARIPVIAVDQPMKMANGKLGKAVAPDNASGGSLAADALIRYWESIEPSDRERIRTPQFLVVEGTGASPERANAFEKQIKKHLGPRTKVVRSGRMAYQYRKGYDWIRTNFRRQRDWDRTVGIFACNDELALGVRDALDSLSLGDPRKRIHIKAAIVGFDGLRDVVKLVKSRQDHWMLNTVCVPVENMAKQVTELIHQAVDQTDSAAPSVVTCNLAMDLEQQSSFRELEERRRKWRAASSQKLNPDVAIITIKKEEYDAVLQQFDRRPRSYVGENRNYVIGRIRHKSNRDLLVAVVKQDGQGNLNAQNAARDAIEDLDPEYLALVGIGGAVPADEFSLGDVVLGNKIYGFDVGAHKNGDTEYATSAGQLSAQSAAFVAGALELKAEDWASAVKLPQPEVDLSNERFYGAKRWQEKTKGALKKRFAENPTRKKPIHYEGAIGGDGFLIKDADIVIGWKKFARDLIVLEMELPGVYMACNRRSHWYPLIVCRGISDIVGFERTEQWTTYACHTAAAFFFELARRHPHFESAATDLRAQSKK